MQCTSLLMKHQTGSPSLTGEVLINTLFTNQEVISASQLTDFWALRLAPIVTGNVK